MNRNDAAALGRLSAALAAEGYEFTTPTPATHARVNARPGNEVARDLRGAMGWSRPFGEGVVPEPVLAALRAVDGVAADGAGARSRLRASSLDGLLFLHSAFPTVAADSVFFGPDTYRFARAIATVLQRPVRRAVDIGCGAGPGAILIARAHPEAAVFGVDINPAALRLTAGNAAAAGVSVQAAHSDVLAGVEGEFDLVVANPPYMADPAARAYRDGGGPLGAALSLRILEEGLARLAPGGTLLLYTGAAVIDGTDALKAEAEARLSGTGSAYTYTEMDPDVFGEELDCPAYATADRIAAVVLVAHRP